MQNMRRGFTMIELILIIAITGILTMIALPKLLATRDDASISMDTARMATCVKDAFAYYAARNIHLNSGDSDACNSVKCFTITYATDNTDFIVETNPTADGYDYCLRIDEVGGHLAKTYQFQGTRVKF